MVSSRFRKAITALALPALLLLTGCPDAQGEFERFGEEYCALNPDKPTCGGEIEGCSGDPCAIPQAGEMDGSYLFTLSSHLSPDQPVVFETELTTEPGPGGLGLQFSLVMHALDSATRSSFVGPPIEAGPFEVDATTGCFDAVFPPLDVAGEANPISGSQLVVPAAELIGQLCAPGDFFCGSVQGQVEQPISIDLAGSTFTFEKLAAPGQIPPQPQKNCDGEVIPPIGG